MVHQNREPARAWGRNRAHNVLGNDVDIASTLDAVREPLLANIRGGAE